MANNCKHRCARLCAQLKYCTSKNEYAAFTLVFDAPFYFTERQTEGVGVRLEDGCVFTHWVNGTLHTKSRKKMGCV